MDWIKRPNPATSTRKRIQFPGIKFPYHHSKRLTHFYTIHMECVCDTYCLKPQELCYREETFRYLAVLRGKCTWHSLRRKAPAKRETSFFFLHYSSFCFSITARNLLNSDFPGKRRQGAVPPLQRTQALLHLFRSLYTHTQQQNDSHDIWFKDGPETLQQQQLELGAFQRQIMKD